MERSGGSREQVFVRGATDRPTAPVPRRIAPGGVRQVFVVSRMTHRFKMPGGFMKITDTIGCLLKSRTRNRILSIAPEQTVYEALQLMAHHDVGALLVISNDELVGIFSERDYARKGILLGHHSRETKVREIMTSPVVAVSPDTTVDECMATMTEHRFRHLPVMQNYTVLGVVSIGDMVKWVISGQEHAIQAL